MSFRITAPFGEVSKIHPYGHTGIDIAVPLNTPLKSITSGVVDKVVDYGDKSIGKGILIKLHDGTTAIYGHMNQISVKIGDTVEQGTLLGLSGSIGRSTGPHLHFGLKDTSGHFIDPSPYTSSLINIDTLELVQRGPEMMSVLDMIKELFQAVLHLDILNFVTPLLELIFKIGGL